MTTQPNSRVLVLCTLLAERYEVGDFIDFDPDQHVDLTFPRSPACRRVEDDEDVVVVTRRGLVEGERRRVEQAFWSFLFAWFDEGGSAEPPLVDLAEVALGKGVDFGEELAREAEARRGPGSGANFPCMLELVGQQLRFVRAVPAEEMRAALQGLAQP